MTWDSMYSFLIYSSAKQTGLPCWLNNFDNKIGKFLEIWSFDRVTNSIGGIFNMHTSNPFPYSRGIQKRKRKRHSHIRLKALDIWCTPHKWIIFYLQLEKCQKYLQFLFKNNHQIFFCVIENYSFILFKDLIRDMLKWYNKVVERNKHHL